MNRINIISAAILTFILCIAAMTGCGKDSSKSVDATVNVDVLFTDPNGLSFISKVEGRYFYIYENQVWTKKFLKGVNMGAAKPGYFPGELAVTKAEHLRWFGYISAMNADAIRVYTILTPDFYDALLDFNKSAKKPLYLFQGVYLNEEDIVILKAGYNSTVESQLKNDFLTSAKNLVDIIHGNATVDPKYGSYPLVYTSDVSHYVIGWILGVEWDPDMVTNINNNNTDKTSDGTYLYASSAATSFEAFLCDVGNEVISYEATKYSMARPVSYANWLTTDTLSHPNEPNPKEDMVSVTTENIKATNKFTPGMFASYHVYPYYPDFLNYQTDYITPVDGVVNTYKAYLKALFAQHTVPVLVAEFGVPASRGIAHESIYSEYNQGNLSETQQGNIESALLQDIYDEGFCGGLVFSWQDEWFKRTWNTMDFDDPDSRPYWSNAQTCEQEFGLLAFDPGSTQSVCYVDGDFSEWTLSDLVYDGADIKLYVKSDEKYLYLMADTLTPGFDFSSSTIFIPVDTIQTQGNSQATFTGQITESGGQVNWQGTAMTQSLQFSRNADFLIKIHGADDSMIMVDEYYDSFLYLYNSSLDTPAAVTAGSGTFNMMYLCMNKELTIPPMNTIVPFSTFPTGKLIYGDANPLHSGFSSLADFCYSSGKVEIRIPWQLLNAMDPSTGKIMDNMYPANGFKTLQADTFYFGASYPTGNTITMFPYTLKTWNITPAYHERLKPSYYILAEKFKLLQ